MKSLPSLLFLLVPFSAPAVVNVFIQDSNSVAWVKYQCTAGEIVCAFALDVTVDQGRILAVSDFLKGPSTAGNTGYGIFPASFRDHITVGPDNSVNWKLQTAGSLFGPWTSTGNTNGLFTESTGNSNQFYQVRGP